MQKQCKCGKALKSNRHKFCSLDCKFLSHFKKGKKTDCWEWISPKNVHGYGILGLPCKRNVLAHRYSFEYFNSKIINKSLCVCHKCDNPPCVNPNHLFLGTKKDNSHDSIKKGRASFPPIYIGANNILVKHPELRPMGEKHHSAKLKQSEVIEIFKSTKNGSELAHKFRVSRTLISQIKRALIWKHILAPKLVGKNIRVHGSIS